MVNILLACKKGIDFKTSLLDRHLAGKFILNDAPGQATRHKYLNFTARVMQTLTSKYRKAKGL
jgi:hypothetical protein